MAVTRVHGGILTDQMLAGSLLHFKMSGINFGYVVSDGTITVGSSTSGGDPGSTTYKLVDNGDPVPESSVELSFRNITEKCTVVQIGLIGDPEVSEVHFSIENTSIGWIDENGDLDVVAMQDAVRSLGTVEVYTTHGGTEGDQTIAPAKANIDLSSVVIEESPYQLA